MLVNCLGTPKQLDHHGQPTQEGDLSDVYVRRSCLARSTKKEAPIFPESTISKFERLSPDSQYMFRSRCRKTLVQLEDKAKQDEVLR